MTVNDPFGGPPREVKIPIPTTRQLKWGGALIPILVFAGGVTMAEMQRNASMDTLLTEVADLKQTPEQVRRIAEHDADNDRRLIALEQTKIMRDAQIADIRNTLQSVADRLDNHGAALNAMSEQVGKLGDKLDNIRLMLEGQPFINSRGRRQQ